MSMRWGIEDQVEAAERVALLEDLVVHLWRNTSYPLATMTADERELFDSILRAADPKAENDS